MQQLLNLREFNKSPCARSSLSSNEHGEYIIVHGPFYSAVPVITIIRRVRVAVK